jgi:chromosomal replication initiation ATPase DnaA
MNMNYQWDYPKSRKKYAQHKKNYKQAYDVLDKSILENIASAVSDVFGVEIDMIKSKRRFRELNVIPKQTICYVARGYNIQHWFVGLFLGYRDHSMSIHGVKTINAVLTYDKEYNRKLERVMAILNYGEEQMETIKDLQTLEA